MMMNNSNKGRELKKSLAVILVLLLTFSGMIPVFANVEGEETQQTVTQAVYDNEPDEEDFTVLYTGDAEVVRYYHPSNTVCEENKIEDPSNGSVELGNTGKFFTYSVNGNNELTWSVDEGIYISAVSVKGGQQNAGFNYFYSEAVSGDSGLHANVKDGSPQGVSHISFCWDEEPLASLSIIKMLLDENEDEIETSDEAFEVLINNSDEEEFWLGDISVDEGFSDDEMELGSYFIRENVDEEDFTVTYWMGETELNVDEDGFIQVDLTQDEQSVTITVQNQPVAEEEPVEETGSLSIVKILLDEDDVEILSSDEPFEIVINDSEGEFWTGSISVDEGFSEDEMELGTYFIREDVDEEDFTVTYWMGETELTVDEDGFIEVELEENGDSVTIYIQNDPEPQDEPEEEEPEGEEPEGEEPEGEEPEEEPEQEVVTSTPSTPTSGVPVVRTTVEEPVVPLAVPEIEVEDPVIILDEPIPLAPPVLPQTGDSNPLYYSLAGLLLMAVGFIFRKRMAA